MNKYIDGLQITLAFVFLCNSSSIDSQKDADDLFNFSNDIDSNYIYEYDSMRLDH